MLSSHWCLIWDLQWRVTINSNRRVITRVTGCLPLKFYVYVEFQSRETAVAGEECLWYEAPVNSAVGIMQDRIVTKSILYFNGFLWSQQNLLAIIRRTEAHSLLCHLRQLHQRDHLEPTTVLQENSDTMNRPEISKIILFWCSAPIIARRAKHSCDYKGLRRTGMN